jgi:hypothetical protein
MAVFAIIHQPGAPVEKLANAITAAYADSNLPLGNGAWLVAGPGTAQDVAGKLGVAPGNEAGSAVVVEAASYFGRANPAIWSWITANWGARPVG